VKTLALAEAAAFLKVHPEELRRKAKAGIIPGAKVGRAWVFIEEDIADYLRSLYAQPRQALRVTWRKEVTECHSTNAERYGGSISPHQAASALDALLAQATKPRLKSSMTS
jgi:excisionase family DNA binding protein